MDIIDVLVRRRSIGKMLKEVPPRSLIERVLEAAVNAPNHHDTQPWRFFVLQGPALDAFGDALADAAQARVGGDASDPKVKGLMLSEKTKPLRSPVNIVVGVVQDSDDPMTRRENLQAASAAMQNMLLAANSLGLAAIWRTGDGAFDDRIKAYFGLRPSDEIAGTVYLGYPDPALAALIPARRRTFADKTTWLE